MMWAVVVWGAPEWLPLALAIAVVLAVLLVWGYMRVSSSAGLRLLAATLKAMGVAILLACLLEPLFSGVRATPGANLFVVLADNSRSLTLRNRDDVQSRGEQVQALVAEKRPWSARLGQDFDVRRYVFDEQLRAVTDFSALAFNGEASGLADALSRLVRRYADRPLAGVLLFTDGNATDLESLEQLLAEQDKRRAGLPPVYPVLHGDGEPASDVSLDRVAVTQTSFEDAPVSLTAQVVTSGYQGQSLAAELLNEQGQSIQQQTARVLEDGKPLAFRFQVKPEHPGVSFYRVRVAAQGEQWQFDDVERAREATMANNTRLAAVDRGHGPYRVLYVCGRPNWEYKFLSRAVQEDDQVQLVGMLRIARREPKFDFRSRAGETTNPLFRGFDNKDPEAVEQYDQPVIVRLGTEDPAELRDGFPKSAEDLFRYQAIVLDDLEAEFFTQDQMQLVKDFVRRRGGGLLMLGGQESFKNGKFDRTPIGELLPVYVDDAPALPTDVRYSVTLTREGWLEPWVRLRGSEADERKRLAAMPGFRTLNTVRGIKPGATVLAVSAMGQDRPSPALVEQRFGRGRSGALLIGDLWRWGLRRPPDEEQDLEKAWRQIVRWLVADVPQRVELQVERNKDDSAGPLLLAVQVRDAMYEPLENATVMLRVVGPGEQALDLPAEPSDRKAGQYVATYVPRQPGAYRAEATATAPDGSSVGQAQAGWTSDPAAEEFRQLRANHEVLQRLAARTGGEIVPADRLETFVAELPNRRAEITEPYIDPLWHRPGVLLLALGCLVGEWGLRRWKGLP